MNTNSAKSVAIVLNLIEERGVKQAFVEGLIDSYRGKLTEWKKGKSSPTIPELTTIAGFFGVSVDYLLGNTSERNAHKPRIFSDGGIEFSVCIKGELPKDEAEALFSAIEASFAKFMLERAENK